MIPANKTDPVLINIPQSMLEDLERCLHHSGLTLFRGDCCRIVRIPEFIRKKEVLQQPVNVV